MSANEFQQAKSADENRDYQRGWDDCLMRVYQVLGEKFTLPKGIGSEMTQRASSYNEASRIVNDLSK